MGIPEELLELFCRPKPEKALWVLESVKHCTIREDICREAIELAKKVIDTCSKKLAVEKCE